MMYSRNNESNDIIIAVIVLTIAFTLMINGGLRAVNPGAFEIEVLIGFSVTVTAFLLHEMAHRTVARRLGAVAFFKLWPVGILMALITSPITLYIS